MLVQDTLCQYLFVGHIRTLITNYFLVLSLFSGAIRKRNFYSSSGCLLCLLINQFSYGCDFVEIRTILRVLFGPFQFIVGLCLYFSFLFSVFYSANRTYFELLKNFWRENVDSRCRLAVMLSWKLECSWA